MDNAPNNTQSSMPVSHGEDPRLYWSLILLRRRSFRVVYRYDRVLAIQEAYIHVTCHISKEMLGRREKYSSRPKHLKKSKEGTYMGTSESVIQL